HHRLDGRHAVSAAAVRLPLRGRRWVHTIGNVQGHGTPIIEGDHNPAMIVTWLSGLYLAWTAQFFSAGWLHGKLLLVFLLSGVHGFFSKCAKDFAADRNTRSQKFYRVINEVPTIMMIGIVILVIVKPF